MTDEYMTLAKAAEVIGIQRPTLHYYIKKLELKTRKFDMNKNRYIATVDVERIKNMREKPWLFEEDTLQLGTVKPDAA